MRQDITRQKEKMEKKTREERKCQDEISNDEAMK